MHKATPAAHDTDLEMAMIRARLQHDAARQSPALNLAAEAAAFDAIEMGFASDQVRWVQMSRQFSSTADLIDHLVGDGGVGAAATTAVPPAPPPAAVPAVVSRARRGLDREEELLRNAIQASLQDPPAQIPGEGEGSAMDPAHARAALCQHWRASSDDSDCLSDGLEFEEEDARQPVEKIGGGAKEAPGSSEELGRLKLRRSATDAMIKSAPESVPAPVSIGIPLLSLDDIEEVELLLRICSFLTPCDWRRLGRVSRHFGSKFEWPISGGGAAGSRSVIQEMARRWSLSTEGKRATIAMIQAAALGQTRDVVRLLVDEGAEADGVDWRDNTAMCYAAQGNHVDMMNVLVAAGAELQKTNGNGWSPIMYGAALGSTEAVRWLLEQGVDWPRRMDRRGRNALAIAREYGKRKCVAELEAWLGVHGTEAEQAVLAEYTTAQRENVALEKREADLQQRREAAQKTFTMALIAATRARNPREVERLLQMDRPDGVSVNGIAGNRLTSLQWAAEQNCVVTMRLLLGAGAELEKAMNGGFTALLLAARAGSTEAVRSLLEHGADWQHTIRGVNALILAQRYGHTETATALAHWICRHRGSCRCRYMLTAAVELVDRK